MGRFLISGYGRAVVPVGHGPDRPAVDDHQVPRPEVRTRFGLANPRRLDQPIAVSREDLVPASHVYRRAETKRDLSFVREWARELDADRGRPSIDPAVCFTLQLVMFFEGLRSERQLMETASLNLAHRFWRAAGVALRVRRSPIPSQAWPMGRSAGR